MRASSSGSNSRGSLRSAIRTAVIAAIAIATGAGSAYAQANLNNYTFAAGSAPYTPLPSTSTTLSALNADDAGSTSVPIGFDFYYMGQRYTYAYVSSNGYLTFNNQWTATATNDLTTATAANRPILAPLWDDLDNTSSSRVSFQTTGTAGSRVCTIEWRNAEWNFGANTPVISFQVRLYESTGVIEYAYRSEAGAISGTGSASVGLTDNAATTGVNFMRSISALSTSAVFPATGATEVANISAKPSSDLLFTFTPPPPPAPSDPTGLTFSTITQTGMTLNWTNPTARAGTAIFVSEDGGTTFRYLGMGSGAAGAQTFNATGLGFGASSTYSFRLYAISEGGIAPTFLAGSQATTAGTATAGVRTVPGDYATLTAAFADIAANGLSADTVLELQPAYTSAGETFPLAVPSNIGPGARLTIRPADSVTSTLTISSAAVGTATIDFNASDYVTIDGDRAGVAGTDRFLTINQTGTTATGTTGTIVLRNGARKNIFRNLNIYGRNNSATSGLFFIGGTSGADVDGNDDNEIRGNLLSHDPGGPAAGGQLLGIRATGTTTLGARGFNDRIIVDGNDFANLYATASTGVQGGMTVADGNHAWSITNNKFYQTATRTFTVSGDVRFINISVGGNNGTFGGAYTITGNQFGGAVTGAMLTPATPMTYGSSSAANTTRIRVIQMFSNNNELTTISNNTIGGISLTTANNTGALVFPAAFGGIGLSTGNYSITNNTIGSSSVDATTAPSITVINNATTAAASNILGIGGFTTGDSTISNNTVGGLLYDNTANAAGGRGVIAGIVLAAGASNVGTVSNNTIGSTTTANSLVVGTPTAVADGDIFGLFLQTPGANVTAQPTFWLNNIQATGNTVANALVRAAAGNLASTQTIGIQNNVGSPSISGNTVRNLTCQGNNVGDDAAQSAIGIGSFSTTGISTIAGNTVHSLSAVATSATPSANRVSGIHFTGSTAATAIPTHVIERNSIHSLANTSTNSGSTEAPFIVGLNIAGLSGSGHRVANNFIRLGIDAAGAGVNLNNLAVQGIRDKSAGASNFWHNSIYIGGAVPAGVTQHSAAYRRTTVPSSGSTDLRNNILSNRRTNTAVSTTQNHVGIWTEGLTQLTSNNNIVWGDTTAGSGHNFAQTGVSATPTAYATQVAWNGASSQDGASSTLDPQFLNATGTATTVDLHISTATGTPVEQGGAADVAITGVVTNDIDSQVRSGLTPVDIGADAGNFILQDLAGPAIAYTAFNNTQSLGGTRTLSVTFTDTTGLETSGGNGPRLYYRKGTSGPFSFVNATTLTGSGPFTGTFDLDQGPLSLAVGDVVQYYVAAQDTVAGTPNVSTNPAGGSGINPPGTTAPTTSAQYTIIAGPLSGTYLVGASQTAPNYANLTAATADFNARGVNGPVTFLLQADYTSVGETFPIAFNVPNPGPSPTAANTVRLKPDTGVTATITGAVNSGGVVLVASDYLTIDGSNTVSGTTRDLSIINTATTAGPAAVALASAAAGTLDGATISNTILRSGTNSGAVGGSGITFAANAGASVAGVFVGTTVSNNDFARARQAIFSTFAAGSDTLTVTGNTATSTGADALGDIGFVVQGAVSNVLVRGNEIANIDGTSGFNDRGIWVTLGATNVVVEENTIRNINNTNAGSWGAWGVASSTGTSSVTIRNNAIRNINGLGFSLTAGTNFAESDNGIGIAVFATGSSAAIHNNSIFLTGNTQTAGASLGIVLATGTSGDLRNNIVENNAGTASGTPGAYALWATTGEAQILSNSNNNNYRVTATGAGTRAIARLGATDQTSLAAYQAAVAGREGASLSVNPLFVSATDLHLQCGSPMVAAGTTIPVLTRDIDGQTRLSPPDIGADETLQPRTPAAQASGLAAVASSCNSLDLSWTPATADGYIVIRRPSAPPTGAPAAVRTTAYLVGDTIGDGTVAFVGAGSSFTDSSLASGTYHYAIFAYNGAAGCQRFLTTTPSTANGTIVSEPTAQATALTSPTQTASSIDVSWTAASPAADGYIVLAVPGPTAPSDVPVDGTTYIAGNSIGAATVVFVGSATSFSHTGLSPNSTFSYAVFSLNTGTACTNYLTAAPLTGTFTSAPPASVSDWTLR